MSTHRDTYHINIVGIQRDLPLFEVAPGLRIAVLNILGDTELVEVCAHTLAIKLASVNFNMIVTAEAKSIPLAHSLSVETHHPYVVLRKVYKPYMGAALSTETDSITTGAQQTLYLDEKDKASLKGKRVLILDDVISTGSTLHGMRVLMEKAGAQVVGEAAIFTEGDPAHWPNVVALGNLPLFKGDSSD